MKKFFYYLFLGIFLLSFPRLSYADVPSPEFMKLTCNSGEKMVECFDGFSFNAPRSQDECNQYRYNPLYRQLTTSNMSSDHGKEKFCLKVTDRMDQILAILTSLFRLTVVTLIIELPIFLFFGYRRLMDLKWVVAANVISVPSMNLLGFFLFSLPIAFFGSDLVLLIMMEVLVVIFETFFILKTTKVYTFKGTLGAVLLANMVSALLGGFLNSLF